ncbi:MAG: stage 0 sporulation protein [Endomicrobium sp.]|jgi:cell fate regulator YaaT (PSP1 superfamily)|nr:stage 0 sporulation protein [Endomicrobium sp.]
MSTLIKIMLRKIKEKIYASCATDAEYFNLQLRDEVILETEHGIEVGVVYEKLGNAKKYKIPLHKILRKVTIEDKKRIIENDEKNSKVWDIVIRKIKVHNLNMKLTCVQYTFDRSKLFIYYTSEIRIDFREFVKDLGRVLKTRIQMVQIGVRDEAKILGGIGICGQVLCCQNFLEDFNSVTMDMAKEQDLSLNTTKLSGLCGRLMCCIYYENETYKSTKEGLPKLGTVIMTPEGKARLVAIDCIKNIVTVDFSTEEFKMFTIKQITKYMNTININDDGN